MLLLASIAFYGVGQFCGQIWGMWKRLRFDVAYDVCASMLKLHASQIEREEGQMRREEGDVRPGEGSGNWEMRIR